MDEKTKRVTEKMNRLMAKGWNPPHASFASEEEMDAELKQREAPVEENSKEADWRNVAIPALGAAAGGLLGGPPGAILGGAAGYGLTQRMDQGSAAPKLEAPKIEAPKLPSSTTEGVGTGGSVTSVEQAGGRFNALKNLVGLGSKGDAVKDAAAKLAWRALAGAGAGAAAGALAGEVLDMDPKALALAGALGGGAAGLYASPVAKAVKKVPKGTFAQRAAMTELGQLQAAQRALNKPMPTEPSAALQALAAKNSAPAAVPVATDVGKWAGGPERIKAFHQKMIAMENARKGLPPEAIGWGAHAPVTGDPIGIKEVLGATKLALDMSHPVLGPLLRQALRAAVLS